MNRGMNVPEKSKRGITGVLQEMISYSGNILIPMIAA